MTQAAPEKSRSHVRIRRATTGPWYVAAVLVGAVLIVAAAYAQPYNQNELQQIGNYDSNSFDEITGTTRQPPLGPLLGALFTHAVGEGQLQQRLVPVLSGIGILTVVALLFRQLRFSWAGVFGLWMLATAPLLIRYGAYTRPYALPVFLMVLFVYAAQRWFDERRARWLVLTAVAATALPLTRVPEPTVFLLTVVVTLALFSLCRVLTRAQTWPVIAIAVAAIVLVDYPMYTKLAAEASGMFDPSISGAVSRFGSGVHEIVTYLLPLLGSWFPWWPLTLLVVVGALALPESRRHLFASWYFWPLLAAPVAFVLAYHFLNTFPLDIRHYRPRMALFFVLPYVLAVVSLAAAAINVEAVSKRLRMGLCVLLGATVIGQLPGSANAVVVNHAVDFGQVADVLTEDLPDDSIVLYDTPSPVGRWRQPFNAKPRYMGDTPYVGVVNSMMKRTGKVPKEGPVYVLILDSECSYSVVCDVPHQHWHRGLQGWHVKKRFDRFTLYEPDSSLGGRDGVIQAMQEFGDAMGPRLGYPETFTAAALLRRQGHDKAGKTLIRQMYQEADPEVADKIRRAARNQNMNRFD